VIAFGKNNLINRIINQRSTNIICSILKQLFSNIRFKKIYWSFIGYSKKIIIEIVFISLDLFKLNCQLILNTIHGPFLL
jgi:hypothetical protein